jgi:hypothetical protein
MILITAQYGSRKHDCVLGSRMHTHKGHWGLGVGLGKVGETATHGCIIGHEPWPEKSYYLFWGNDDLGIVFQHEIWRMVGAAVGYLTTPVWPSSE